MRVQSAATTGKVHPTSSAYKPSQIAAQPASPAQRRQPAGGLNAPEARTKLKVGVAHVAPVFMDAMATAQKAATWIEKAHDQGLNLLVFPEVFMPGFPYWINLYPPLVQADVNRAYQDQSVELGGPELSLVQEAAQRWGVAVSMGISERRAGGRTCYNASVLIENDGQILSLHRKLMPTYAERYIWGMGDGSMLNVTDASVGRVGSLICWEHTMNLARQALIEQDEQLHTAHFIALDTMPGWDTVANTQIDAMMRNHALTGQCYVAAASSPVTQEILTYMDKHLGPQNFMTAGGGYSAIIHPFTDALAGPYTGAEEKLLSVEINLENIKDVKMWVDSTGHYARPDVFKLVVDRSAKPSSEFYGIPMTPEDYREERPELS